DRPFCAAAIVDHEGPAHAFAQALGEHPAEHVGPAAGREWRNDAHGLRWIIVRALLGRLPDTARAQRCHHSKIEKATHHRGSINAIRTLRSMVNPAPHSILIFASRTTL